MMFSRKTRLAGAALLMASMALGGTAWGQSYSSDTTLSGGLKITAKSVVVEDGVAVTAPDSSSLEEGASIILGRGSSLAVGEDLEIFYGSITMNGSTITTNDTSANGGTSAGSGYGINLGWYDETFYGDSTAAEAGPALISINGQNNSLVVGGFLAIKGGGELRLEKNAAADFRVYADDDTDSDGLLDSGVFMVGDMGNIMTKYVDEFGHYSTDWDDGKIPSDEEPTMGGLLYLGEGSEAVIGGHDGAGNQTGGARAVFGGVGYGGEDWAQWVASGGSDVGLHLAKDSHLQINGKAWFLSNSLLTVDQTSGDAAISATDTITIQKNAWVRIKNGSVDDVLMEADGGFIIEQALMNPIYTFRISNNQMLIDSMSSSRVMESFGQNGNYAGADRLINNIFDNTTGISEELKNRLADNLQQIGFTDGKLAETALKQLIGEEALAANTAVQNSLSQGNQALGQRFQALRGTVSPSAGAGDAENRLWVGGFGQWSKQDDADNVYGYDYNSVGVMLGYDREIAALPGLTVGFNGSWNNSTVENNSGLAESDIDSFGLGLYGLYEFSGGFFIEGDLGYGHAKNDSEITLAMGGGKKSGDFDIDSFQAGLNLGYDYRFEGGAILTPSAGLRYTHIKQDGWRERIVTDPNNMAVANWFDDSTQNFLEFPTNLKLAKTFETRGGATITPELRVGAIFTANDPESSLRMGFVGSNDSVTINGIDPGRSRFTAGTGIKARLNDTVDLFTGYDLEARSGYTGHSASLGLGFSF